MTFSRPALLCGTTRKAIDLCEKLRKSHRFFPLGDADCLVVVGGDGMMLRALHAVMDAPKPVFGLKAGSLGFLMNEGSSERLVERLNDASQSRVNPLFVTMRDRSGVLHEIRAFNEISVLRQSSQATRLSIAIDAEPRITELSADGVIVATPIGSTAYNLSLGGPVIPLGMPLLALTPIAPSRPRGWRGALLPDKCCIKIEIRDADTRPVLTCADNIALPNVVEISAHTDFTTELVLLHDRCDGLDERIMHQQFLASPPMRARAH